ncbi:MAG: prepilin-type N-terminal cleavage/methylation domain-containing protein [Oculatellaceae cyanobacterium bins.114]|nr:prepilin-type N-terminal cleavage/methylation domain-containing protein [Oculatellaceae cyanobacterium bins.114]
MKRITIDVLLSSKTAGFTLLELLLAMTLTSIMLALTASGIVSMMRADQKTESEIARRITLNQSMDFMADEIRMAKRIAVPANGSIPTPSCGTATGVLTLTMPDNSLISYYVNNINACSNTVWLKPVVINRRVVASNNTVTSDTVLVDALIAPATQPTCAAQLSGANGFYACIDTNNRSATLYLYGRVVDALGNTSEIYPVVSQTSTRSF